MDSPLPKHSPRRAPETDVDELAQVVKKRFDAVEKTLAGLESRFDKLDDGVTNINDQLTSFDAALKKVLHVQTSMLTTLDSIDGKLKDMSDHTERIIRLEDHAFGPGH